MWQFVIISRCQTSLVATWHEVSLSMTPSWPHIPLCLLLTQGSSALTHPCHSERGRDTDICKQLASLCHQSEVKMSVCDEIEDRMDVGIALLEPSAGITSPWHFLKKDFLPFLFHRYQILNSCGGRELSNLSYQHSWRSRRLLQWLWIPRPERMENTAKKYRRRKFL